MANGKYYDELTFNTHDYIIGGKLVVCHATLEPSFSDLMRVDYDARLRFKQDMAHRMAEFMLENKLVEFTQARDPYTDSIRVACRAYLAPDEQVKILRVANKIV